MITFAPMMEIIYIAIVILIGIWLNWYTRRVK